MKNFKEYSFGGGATGPYRPIADVGDFAGKSYYGGLYANAEKKITQSDLDQVEKYADRLFASLKIDVEFTKHFMDRVNDARNLKQITVAELIRLFKQAYRRYGKKIAKMTDQANAVINDMKTDINMPFVIDVDSGGDMELIAKTVMRKKNFTTSASSPKLSFESFQSKLDEVANADFAPVAHQQSLSKIIFSPAGYGTDTSATSTIRGGPGSVANSMWMPITGSIFKRVFPKQVRTTTFHVTNFRYFDQLYAIQNSRRSISTFANMDRKSIYQGIQAGSGLVIEVEGNVLAAAKEDVMSIPELSGRRMMAFNFFRGPWGEKDVMKMQKGLERLLKTLVNRYYTAFGNDYGNMVPSPRDDDFTKWRHIRAAYDQAKSKRDRTAGRTMQKIVKEYMDGVEKVFIQNAKQVQDTLTRYIERKKTDEQWDEIVVDDFNIKKVYIIEDSDELMPGEAEEFINQISLTKLPVARVYSHDMEEYARDIAQGKNVKLNTTVRDAYLDLVKDTPDSAKPSKPKSGKIEITGMSPLGVHTQKEQFNEAPRIPRKKGQPAGSDKHSDLYTDEDPRGTIHGLGFKDVETAKASVKKIEGSDRTHAHKIQAAIAMEQRARVMGKTAEAAVYRKYIEKMKKKTKEMRKKKMNEDEHGFKCPPGYKFDSEIMQCVPKKSRFKTLRYYPYFLSRNGSSSNQQSDQSQDGQNGNGNGAGNGNGNGNGAGNGGGNGCGNGNNEVYLAADVRKMPGGGYGVFADKFVKGKRVMTPGGKHQKELKKVYKNKKDANDYMAAIMIAKGGG